MKEANNRRRSQDEAYHVTSNLSTVMKKNIVVERSYTIHNEIEVHSYEHVFALPTPPFSLVINSNNQKVSLPHV